MARTYNKSVNEAKATAVKPAAEKPAEVKAAPAKRAVASAKEPDTSVIAAPDAAVMQQIVYQPSAQILTREVAPNESFGVGDAMPIYYL